MLFTIAALAPRAQPPKAAHSPAATEVGAATALELVLKDGTVQFADGTVLLEEAASELRPSPSASGGIFLHAEFGAAADTHDIKLGLLCGSRLLGCARTTRYWVAPCFCDTASELPLETQFVLVERAPGGPYALLLPLLDDAFRSTLGTRRRPSLWSRLTESKASRQRALWAHVESGDGAVRCRSARALYVAAGSDPFELLRRGFAEVAARTGTFRVLSQKQLPASVGQFGWCTWDAFYSQVTPAAVVSGLRSLQEAGVPPRVLILDDGWQTVTPVKPPPPPPSAEPPAASERMTGALLGAVNRFEDGTLRKAAPRALSARAWRALVRGPLKGLMWSFFDGETDFARQLGSFAANPKFEAPQSGGSLAGLVETARREFGVQTVYAWHALHGYWRGISAELAESAGIASVCEPRRPSEHLLAMEPRLGWDPMTLFGAGLATDPEGLRKLYDGLHGGEREPPAPRHRHAPTPHDA